MLSNLAAALISAAFNLYVQTDQVPFSYSQVNLSSV